MTKQQIENRIKVLTTKLNAMTQRCPLRHKVAIREEIRTLQAKL